MLTVIFGLFVGILLGLTGGGGGIVTLPILMMGGFVAQTFKSETFLRLSKFK